MYWQMVDTMYGKEDVKIITKRAIFYLSILTRLPNVRGVFYSRSHISLSPDQPEFWNFTCYEIGVYDYPAVFDYIMSKTETSSVYVAAQSMGTTSMMILLSEKPEYNQFIRAVSLLAPVAYFRNTDLVLRSLAAIRNVFQVQ